MTYNIYIKSHSEDDRDSDTLDNDTKQETQIPLKIEQIKNITILKNYFYTQKIIAISICIIVILLLICSQILIFQKIQYQ